MTGFSTTDKPTYPLFVDSRLVKGMTSGRGVAFTRGPNS
jgi:hypothetical protein